MGAIAHHRRLYHYDLGTALEELNQDGVLPHPVHVGDMIVRAKLAPDRALELGRQFKAYVHDFGELQSLVAAGARVELAQLKEGQTCSGPCFKLNRPVVWGDRNSAGFRLSHGSTLPRHWPLAEALGAAILAAHRPH